MNVAIKNKQKGSQLNVNRSTTTKMANFQIKELAENIFEGKKNTSHQMTKK